MSKPLIFFITVIILFLSLYSLETIPPLWRGEGWTLSSASNLVEFDHYGKFRLDMTFLEIF
jgi:hypothetical protein